MSKYGEVLESGALRFVRELPGPIDRVWSWLVDPEKRALWLAGGNTDGRVGGKIELSFDNESLTPHHDPVTEKYADQTNVGFECEITTWEPPHKLGFMWPNRHGGADEVTFELMESGDKIRLELIHRGITHPDDLIGATAGWHRHFDIMAEKFDGRIPTEPFWGPHDLLEDEYRGRFEVLLKAMRPVSD